MVVEALNKMDDAVDGYVVAREQGDLAARVEAAICLMNAVGEAALAIDLTDN